MNLKKLLKIDGNFISLQKNKMLLPIRCFTCNKILGQYSDYLEKNKVNDDFFKENHIKRYCCKKILISSVDIHKDLYGERDNTFYKMKKYSEVKKIMVAR